MGDGEPTGNHRSAGDGSFDPPPAFAESADVSDGGRREAFAESWPGCWDRAARMLDWEAPHDAVLAGETPPFEWFAGGRLNAAYNCVDRHVEEGHKNHAAIIWEGKRSERRTYTYVDLYREVNEFAAALRDLGIGEGDVVTLYMPAIPELVVAMLACARIGAPHNVVFAGFSADALATRMESADSAHLVTCDGYYRRGSAVNQKNKADNARIKAANDVEDVVVVERFGDDGDGGGIHLDDGYHEYAELLCRHAGETVDPVTRGAGDLLFLIYTSGTTGQPKGVRHTTGGYLAHVAWTSHAVLDLGPEDIYWCSADIGWITGHSYVVYGPLALGATTVLYEGTPDHPEKNRVWRIIERNAVDVFYTAPTAIRAFMKWGETYPAGHDLSSLRLLGTVGEPINPRAWEWYYRHVGGEECPVVDTWWQSETGSILISTLPGVDRMKPGVAGPPLPGIEARVVNAAGDPVETGRPGRLAITRPWPGMSKDLAETETAGVGEADWSYVTEDRARIDGDGYVAVLGRSDDSITVAGRRLGTSALENAIVDVPGVAEAAVVDVAGGSDDSVYAFVSTEEGCAGDDATRRQIRERIAAAVGEFAVPETVVFTPELPKTRSGKLMRRLLRDVTGGEPLGDTSALRNPEIVGELESAVRDH